MSKADAVAAILLAGATLYAVFGGADFGAGFWHLLAGRDAPELRRRVRARIGTSIGPVWEANHVWLIFALVVLWSAFPSAFAAIMQTVYLPLALAAFGIVLRGSGFAFGHVLEGRAADRAGLAFALSSLLTPFFMGTVVGAVAAGEVRTGETPGPFEAWVGPLQIATGVLFVATGAYLASVFLLDESRRGGDEVLVDYFRRRAIAAGLVTGALALASLIVVHSDARFIYDGLTGPALPLVIASALLGLVTLIGLLRGWTRALRPTAIGAVVAVIAGWGVAQHPYLLPETLKIGQGAGAEATLTAVIIVFGVALITVAPALAFLYRLAQRQALE